MRRVFFSLITILISLAATGQVKHFITLSGQVGEASYLYDFKSTDAAATTKQKASFGVGGGLGAGYELQAGAFLFDLGLTLHVTHSIANLGVMSDTIFHILDDDPMGGDYYDYIFNQTGRKDSYTDFSLQVPVMIGAKAKRFYFLAGVKFDLSLLAVGGTKAMMSSQADYEKYGIAPSSIARLNTFTNEMFSQRSGIKFKPQVMASVEIGWRLGEIAEGTGWDVPKQKRYWRLALFADYGFLNMLTPQNNDLITLPTSKESDMKAAVTVNNLFSTSQVTKINNLMVGVKATYLMQLPEKRMCTICHDAYRGVSKNGTPTGGGRIEFDRQPKR